MTHPFESIRGIMENEDAMAAPVVLTNHLPHPGATFDTYREVRRNQSEKLGHISPEIGK